MKEIIRKYAAKDVPDLQERIRNSPEFTTYLESTERLNQKRPLLGRGRLAFYGAFAVIVLLALFLMPSFSSAQHASLYIEINPRFTILITQDNTIADLIAENEDAETLLSSLEHLKGEPLDSGLEDILNYAVTSGYLMEGSSFFYDIDSEHRRWQQEALDDIEATLLNIVSERLPDIAALRGFGGQPTDYEQSLLEHYDIGLMHARLIGNILKDNPEMEIENLIEMNPRELMNMLNDFATPRSRHPFDNNMPNRPDIPTPPRP